VGRIVARHWVNADLKRVFAFVSDPHNLLRLMPEEKDVRLEELRLVSSIGEKPKSVVESGGDTDAVVESGGDRPQIAGPGSQIAISFRLVLFLPFRGG
jgi:hypothetical protein